jgi:L-ascorbate metabolism protein UlaG (beta-lactamase superfamily)
VTVRHDDLDVDWLGYATLRVAGPETTVYFDPGRYGVLDGTWEPGSDRQAGGHPAPTDYDARDGDVVFVTHVHHYDPDGIRRVADDDATLVVFEGLNVRDSDRDLERPADLDYDLVTVSHEADLLAADCPVHTVPAYNDPDGPNVRADGTPIHPEGFGCGFLVAVDGTRVFWPGDSDVLPGHEELTVSLFCPPIGRSFTMDREDAADLAESLDPDLVVPIHYNTFDALEADDGAFAADVAARSVPVALDR